MLEGSCLRLHLQILSRVCDAGKAEFAQHVDGWIAERSLIISLMKVTRAANIGMLADGGRFGGVPGGFVGFDECGDALAVQAADLERTARNGFGLRRADCLIELEHAEACSEALFRMRPAGKNCDYKPLVCGPTERAQRRKRIVPTGVV
ncbi:hypothetical protein [Mesorhizobium prunaredense]|nr:hypothetical protein [Mesorhizobium prunaredense]